MGATWPRWSAFTGLLLSQHRGLLATSPLLVAWDCSASHSRPTRDAAHTVAHADVVCRLLRVDRSELERLVRRLEFRSAPAGTDHGPVAGGGCGVHVRQLACESRSCSCCFEPQRSAASCISRPFTRCSRSCRPSSCVRCPMACWRSGRRVCSRRIWVANGRRSGRTTSRSWPRSWRAAWRSWHFAAHRVESASRVARCSRRRQLC